MFFFRSSCERDTFCVSFIIYKHEPFSSMLFDFLVLFTEVSVFLPENLENTSKIT